MDHFLCVRYMSPTKSLSIEMVKNRDDKGHFVRKNARRMFQGYIDGAIDKAYARIGGMDMPLNIKSPYIPLNNEDFEWLKSVIRMEFADS